MSRFGCYLPMKYQGCDIILKGEGLIHLSIDKKLIGNIITKKQKNKTSNKFIYIVEATWKPREWYMKPKVVYTHETTFPTSDELQKILYNGIRKVIERHYSLY